MGGKTQNKSKDKSKAQDDLCAPAGTSSSEDIFGPVELKEAVKEIDQFQNLIYLTKGVSICKESLRFTWDQKTDICIEFLCNVYSRYGKIIINVLSAEDGSDGTVIKKNIVPAIELNVKRGSAQPFEQHSTLSPKASALMGKKDDCHLLIHTYGMEEEERNTNKSISDALYVGVVECKQTFYKVWIGYHAIKLGRSIYVLHRLDEFDHEDVNSPHKESLISELGLFSDEIGYGEFGTVVYKGMYNLLPVAVKSRHNVDPVRLENELEALSKAGQHKNLVSYYGVRHCHPKNCYIILERCFCCLPELFNIKSQTQSSKQEKLSRIANDLWNVPSSPVLKDLLRDILRGVAHLHEQRIIHGDIKPGNVLLVSNDFGTTAKVSNMNNSICLPPQASTALKTTNGRDKIGTCGWRAPEIISEPHYMYPADAFSCGLVLYHIISQGEHPISAKDTPTDEHITKKEVQLFYVNDTPDLEDLLSGLLQTNINERLTLAEACAHPAFWRGHKIIGFLRDAFEVLKGLEKYGDPDLILHSVKNLQLYKSWEQHFSNKFMMVLGVYPHNGNAYTLLRLIRNKYAHIGEEDDSVKSELGYPAFYNTFHQKYPALLIDVYKIFKSHPKDPKLAQYF